ncbi:hypothetical protein FEM48_Zijuj02G0108700 [Ziziphus jujuba var. spinosa]|uniref:Uncharacterized protein n=1 Tax=Ziziphus jujuba var. spinosa TaxID=714518 RepID=A0A978VVB3_ZIZJJ|nr:hypothetical protein FEM48_Zijuj02G0108700 [Ziziphus jujuba var. spinosa]
MSRIGDGGVLEFEEHSSGGCQTEWKASIEEIIFGLLPKSLEEGYCKGETDLILKGIPKTMIQVEIKSTKEQIVFPCGQFLSMSNSSATDTGDPNSSNDDSHKKNDSPPIGFHVQDNSLITPERLDGTQLCTKAAPKDEHSEEYETWQDENCLVKPWLLDAMSKDIRSLFLRLGTAKEIWDAARRTYSVD